MFRYLVSVIAAVVVLAEEPLEEFKLCTKVLYPVNRHCCKMESPTMTSELAKILKECFQRPGDSPTCERDICMATKRSFGTDDGKLIKEKAKEIIESDFPDQPKLIAAIQEKCLDGDLTNYGLPAMCELTKFRHCTEIQVLALCPEWSNSGPCDGAEEDFKKCLKMYE